MGNLRKLFSQLNFDPGSAEMRIFWFFLPLILAILALNVLYLASPLNIFAGLLLALVGAVVYFTSAWISGLNLKSRLEKNELMGIVSGLEDALVVHDQNLKVTFFNPAAQHLFSLRQEDVLDRVLRPQDVEVAPLKLLAQVIFPSLAPVLIPRSRSGEYPQIADLSFAEAGLELRVTTVPLADDKGRLRGFLKIIRNRTREVALIRSKQEFITVASHQLRTPITELNWALETISQDTGLAADMKSLAENALNSARKMLHIVEDLLSVSRLEEGRFGYSFESTDPAALVGKILADAMPAANRSGLQLYFERPKEELPQVTVDVQKLSMVLSNLVDNAIRYNVPNGQIVVTLEKVADQPYVEVRVKDTGIGLPAEEMEKLFSKFFRASNAVKFQADGSGLGLYIARNIIQAHGGQIWAESELNRGTTVHFTIPTDPSLVPQKEVALE
ncbi:MAG: Multi-sensor signal transduction histidine kinase [Parcubacteria group bacterium GW2011_GWA1_59_11]|nr:MAG: Multi-sensor signal transduction histidine kinase [Parcubacteria group bacterium GW2011_GWA1_59_11]